MGQPTKYIVGNTVQRRWCAPSDENGIIIDTRPATTIAGIDRTETETTKYLIDFKCEKVWCLEDDIRLFAYNTEGQEQKKSEAPITYLLDHRAKQHPSLRKPKSERKTSAKAIQIRKRDQTIVEDVIAERLRQITAYPPRGGGANPGTSETRKLAILAKKFGDVATNVIEIQLRVEGGSYKVIATKQTLRTELVQVAAVVFAWIEGHDYTEDDTDGRSATAGATLVRNRSQTIVEDVIAERLRQVAKFPPMGGCANREISETSKLAVLAEEFGEVASDINEIRLQAKGGPYKGTATKQTVRTELVQVAAVVFAWIESIDDVNADINADINADTFANPMG